MAEREPGEDNLRHDRLIVAWFSTLVVAALTLAIVHLGQMRELLLDAADPVTGARFVFLLSAVVFAAGSAWYFTRALLYVDYRPSGTARASTIRASRMLSIAIAFSAVGLIALPGLAVFWMAFVLAALALAMLVGVVPGVRGADDAFRRKWLLRSPALLLIVPFAGMVLTRPSLPWFVLLAVAVAALAGVATLQYRRARTAVVPVDGSAPADPLRTWLPRVLGLLVIVPVGALYAVHRLWMAAAIVFAAALVFLLTLVMRRYRAGRAGRWRLVELWRAFTAPPPLSDRRELPAHTFSVLLVVVGLTQLLAVAFLVWQVPLAQALGAGAILYLAVGSWLAFGNLALVYPARRYRTLSFFLALPVIAFGMSQLRDKHDIRVCGVTANCPTVAATTTRPTLETHYARWLAHRRDAIDARNNEGRPYPVFVVTAEGGGIRAAYWTSIALATIQDRYPAFYCHVFAISGVSGGSLGAAVYTALLADRLAAAPAAACAATDAGPGPGPLRARAAASLQPDFLAPVAAGLMFSDLLQLFLPVSWPDRAAFLEQSWERAWTEANDSTRMSESFVSLWHGDLAMVVPGLLLNATQVSDGRRVIASNVAVGRAGGDRFLDATSLAALVVDPLPLSTVVHLSARFPYVSPTGAIPEHPFRESLVDGGYFEEVGALTALETLESMRGVPAGDERVALYVIAIVNREPDDGGGWPVARNGFARELAAPAKALLETRVARGTHATAALRARAGHDRYIELPLVDPARADDRVPFAWSLTDRTERIMERSIDAWLDEASGSNGAQHLRRLLQRDAK